MGNPQAPHSKHPYNDTLPSKHPYCHLPPWNILAVRFSLTTSVLPIIPFCIPIAEPFLQNIPIVTSLLETSLLFDSPLQHPCCRSFLFASLLCGSPLIPSPGRGRRGRGSNRPRYKPMSFPSPLSPGTLSRRGIVTADLTHTLGNRDGVGNLQVDAFEDHTADHMERDLGRVS